MDRAYLSIVDWPSGWGIDRRVEALALGVGIDPADGRLIAPRGVPRVIALIDAGLREEVVGALHELGVTAFAPTRAEVRALGAPERIKGMFVFPDRSALGLEMWRGEAGVLRAQDIRLIVRGEARVTRTEVRESPMGADMEWAPYGGVLWPGPGGGVIVPDAGGPERATVTTTAGLLDIHAAEPEGRSGGGSRWLRVDADKVSFEVLGELKGMTDGQNMATLTALLAGLARGATVDEGFGRFGVPAEMERSRGSAARTAAFDFYSAWLALLYRSLGAL